MKKYMVLYHAPVDAFASMAEMTEEQKQTGMQVWLDWQTKAGDAIVDFGSPLMMGQAIAPDGSVVASTKEVAGYSILQAEDMSAVQALLLDHPHLAWTDGCRIEVHELAPMM